MPSEKQSRERKENIASILQYIRMNNAKSRRQIADELGLSWGCVSELVSILLVQKVLLEESVAGVKSKGRAPTVLSLNEDICFLGVDINTNGLNACVCNLLGEKVATESRGLCCDNKQRFIETVGAFVNGILKEHTNIFGIGFAMQGICDGDVWEFPAGKGIAVNFTEDFGERLSVPLMVEHDPNCILYGCLDDTTASKMIIRLDKGIGAAMYTENGFLRNGLLELGYLVMNERGEKLHDILSLSAMERVLGTSVNAETPDQKTRQYFETAGQALGVALGNVCNLLCLDEIYICGGMIAYYPLFNDAMERGYLKTVLPTQKAKISAVKVTDAAYGAAKMAMDRFMQ